MKIFSRKLGKWLEFREWTDEEEAILLADRAAGKANDTIAARLNRGVGSIQRKIRRMNLEPRQSAVHRVGRRIEPVEPPREPSIREAYGSEPLPAGHPISWGAIALRQEEA